MLQIDLGRLQIKKMDPNDKKDIWLVNQFDHEELKNNGLWNLNTIINSASDIQSDCIYGSHYIILFKNNPVGYLHISDIYELNSFVNLSYAILQQERKKGYVKNTLTMISNLLLKEIKRIELIIDVVNIGSQYVACDSGYKPQLTDVEQQELGFNIYEKKRTLIK